MNPKCLGGSVPDTSSARSAHLTGLKMRRITRAVSIDRIAFETHQPGPRCRISNCKRSVSGHAGILQPVLVLPTLAGDRPLHIRHDERADRAVVAAAPEAYVAMGVLTRLHLLTLEQVDVKLARTRLHQLIAGDREAIHVAAAG